MICRTKRIGLAALALPLVLAAGCATNEDLDQLRSELRAEIRELKEMTAAAQRDAAAARQSAAEAAAASTAASDKADRVLRQSLRK
ncbi:MAG: hypothetical protein QNI94_10340 [Kiloniellales bacterium]|nr:hypothetical protein [Kiloniellales bacterium]